MKALWFLFLLSLVGAQIGSHRPEGIMYSQYSPLMFLYSYIVKEKACTANCLLIFTANVLAIVVIDSAHLYN